MIKISIVVPLHNSEKYLRECMDSILKQSLKDIEIICIDSSTDDTIKIMKQYMKADARIQMIHDENSSYGHKLNVGIRSAKGKYIGIVESDDFIAVDMMEKLYKVAEEFQPDIVKANFEGFIDCFNIRKFCKMSRVKEDAYNTVINLEHMPEMRFYIGYNIWAGIYRTEFLKKNKICFHESEGASFQDVGFSNLTAIFAENLYLLEDCLYKYRMDNEGSSVKADNKYKCISEEYQWLKQQMEERDCMTDKNKIFFGIKKLESYFWNYIRLSGDYRKLFIDYISNEELDDFDERKSDFTVSNKEMILGICKGSREYISLLDKIEENKKRVYTSLYRFFQNESKLVIVSAGTYARAVLQFAEIMGYQKEIVVCDNNYEKIGMKFENVNIYSVEEAVEMFSEAKFIVANKRAHKELLHQLLQMGVRQENILICDDISSDIGLIEEFNRYCNKGSIV